VRPNPIHLKEWQYSIALYRDQKAYSKLFLHFYKPLTHFAVSLVKNKEAAEEIFSDVMLKVWDIGAALEKIENLSTYLFIAIKNTALNYLSRYHKAKFVDITQVDIDLLQAYDPQQDECLKIELKHTMAASIKALPPKCQLVYLLIKEYGLSYKQVAEIVGISVNTVEGHMTTAMKKMAHSLKVYMDSDTEK